MRLSLICVMLFAVVFLLFGPDPNAACAAHAPTDAETAQRIVDLLAVKFSPESLLVTVDGSRAYAVMRGAVLSKIRIDTMRLEALLHGGLPPAASSDEDELEAMIGYSKGEIVLLERDVNNYFKVNESSGFSNLIFDFSPKGFKAKGIFSASFLFNLRIRLEATGVLALRSDGVYLDKVDIFVEGVRQPEMLTSRIVGRVNPLIEFKDIPFKVEFKSISMNETEARMTGGPKKFQGGSTVTWHKKKQ